MASKDKKKIEMEPRAEQVLASLSEKHESQKKEQAVSSHEWMEKQISELPADEQNDVREVAARFDKTLEKIPLEHEEARKSVEELRASTVSEKIRDYAVAYNENRFEGVGGKKIRKEAYSKKQFGAWFQELLSESPKVEDLKKIARLSFDANGLKAVNDLSASHENGTEYLKRIAHVFDAEDSAERKRLEELGMKDVLFTTGGGDEYSLLVRSEKPIDPKVLDEAVRLYEDAIARLDVSDLVDFDDPGVRLRYMGLTRDQYEMMSEADRRALDEKTEKEIPKGFAMRASAAGGAATVYDGLVKAMRHPSKPLTEEDEYLASINKIMGGVWDASDEAAADGKAMFKAELRGAGGDPSDRFYSKVLARTTEARVLEEQVGELVDKNARLEKMQAELDKLDELHEVGGVSFGEYKRLKEEIKRRYRSGSEAAG